MTTVGRDLGISIVSSKGGLSYSTVPDRSTGTLALYSAQREAGPTDLAGNTLQSPFLNFLFTRDLKTDYATGRKNVLM